MPRSGFLALNHAQLKLQKRLADATNLQMPPTTTSFVFS